MRKKKISIVDGVICLEPGFYRLTRPIQYPRTSKRNDDAKWAGKDWWPAGEMFVIKKHISEIGAQTTFQYYTVQKLHSQHYQVKSYEAERWNMLAGFLEPVDA